jgi:hypothetical protein
MIHWDLSPVHDPLSDTINPLALVGTGRDGVETPVNEHSESSFTPPFHTLIVGQRRLLGANAHARQGIHRSITASQKKAANQA